MAFLSTLLNLTLLFLLLCSGLQLTGSARSSGEEFFCIACVKIPALCVMYRLLGFFFTLRVIGYPTCIRLNINACDRFCVPEYNKYYSAFLERSRSRPKKKHGDTIQLSLNIGTNPFLTNATNVGSNTFYQRNPFLTGAPVVAPHTTERDVSVNQPNYKPSTPNNMYTGNPFLQPSITNRDHDKNSPITQPTSRPLPQPIRHPESSTSYSGVIDFPDDTVTFQPFPQIGPIKINPRTKSDIKCEQYSRDMLNTVQVGTLAGTGSSAIKVSSETCRPVSSLVVGGTAASIGEFPHMVALGRQTGDEFKIFCGGSLISPSWVLSAAHCTHGPTGSPNMAKLGCIDLKNDPNTVSVGIRRLLRHPAYRPPAKYSDIALIALQESVTFSDIIKPACLYQYYDTVPIQATATGWGVTEFGGVSSDSLQKVQLQIIDNVACTLRHNSSLSVPHGVSPSMICAGDPRGGWNKDTCQGDSGGPLHITHPRNPCIFEVIGITSFGDGCAVIDSPGVYIRVAHYLSWIEDIVWPDN